MSIFELFKEVFDAKYEGDIYEFIGDSDMDRELPFGGKLIENLDEEEYNSYGAEDSTLERIYYFEDFDIYVSFEGTRQSYSGEEWNDFKEVKQTTKTIQVWTKVD